MSTAILSALPEEQAGLLPLLDSALSRSHAGRIFWEGHLHGQPVVLALSGIGKVAAATTATALIERFGVRRIVFTGVAGGVGPGVRVGDLVVAKHYVQHDMDASPLFPRWEVPGYARACLDCDGDLSALLVQAATVGLRGVALQAALQAGPSPSRPQVHHGLMASGDRFVATAQAARQLTAELSAAGHLVLAVEMEGAAVAQVCVDYGVPFAAVRTISDRADEDAPTDFLQFVRTVASPYAEQVVLHLLQMLPVIQKA